MRRSPCLAAIIDASALSRGDGCRWSGKDNDAVSSPFTRHLAAPFGTPQTPLTRSLRRESTITAGCLLSRPVRDAADARHRCRGRVTNAQPARAIAATAPAVDCGGEPCDAVARGLRRLSRPKPRRSRRKRARVRRLPHADRSASSCRRRASRRDFSSCSGGAAGIRRPTIRCSGPSMPTISGPTVMPPAISAIFARTVSSGSPSRCRRTSG